MSNECGAVIRRMPLGEVEKILRELAQTEEVCTARWSHRRALNTFPGFKSIESFICSECGGVVVDVSLQ